MTPERLAASFRDPSGFMYVAGKELYRQVNRVYQEHYDRLMASGLYEALVKKSWLIPHAEVPVDQRSFSEAYRILRPERIPYISYPYEWCFSQLKDAALLTLDIQMLSLSFGMTLKDASAYNVQFVGHRPIFIDTLSFEIYREGRPWVPYRQFCQHFLAPLALMSHVDGRLGHLLRTYLDGIPLDLASRLLPAATRLRPSLLLHIHAHARSQKQHEHDGMKAERVGVPRLPKGRLIALLGSLRAAVRRCGPALQSTEWGDYYEDTNYSAAAMAAKESTVRRMVDTFAAPGEVIHDLGANTGRFSRLIAAPGRYVVSHDLDELAVERNYLEAKSQAVGGLLPLVLDLTNPSPPIGWALAERASSLDRLSHGTVLALALVHHLAIANNVPLPHLGEFFGSFANTLVIEFVPKEDSQVRRLLATRADVFPEYCQDEFERTFTAIFEVCGKERIPDSHRSLYAMRRKV